METQQRAESTFTIVSKVKNSARIGSIVKWIHNNMLLVLILVSVIFGVTVGECKRGRDYTAFVVPENTSSDQSRGWQGRALELFTVENDTLTAERAATNPTDRHNIR